jgi:hypothetical protein
MRSLALTLRAHIERDGCHHERFDAYLDDELISTSRSGWHDPARKLLELGHDPETLLHVQHHGRAFDPTIARASAGLLGGVSASYGRCSARPRRQSRFSTRQFVLAQKIEVRLNGTGSSLKESTHAEKVRI